MVSLVSLQVPGKNPSFWRFGTYTSPPNPQPPWKALLAAKPVLKSRTMASEIDGFHGLLGAPSG
jgi:hypothetical protein